MLVAVLALASVPATLLASVAPQESAVITAPAGSTTVSLDTPSTYAVEGREGVVTVRVGDGRVWVAHAECPDSVCVRSGTAAPGRPVVCAPNGVAVSVRGSEGGGLDARSR